MVSVFSLFSTFLLVLFLVIVTTVLFSYKGEPTLKAVFAEISYHISKQIYNNIIYLFVFFALFIYQFPYASIYGFLFIGVVSYFQRGVWVEYLEALLVSLPMGLRKVVLSKLLKEDSTITHKTLHSYIYEILRGQVHEFRDMLKLTLSDIRVGIFFIDPGFTFNSVLKKIYEIEKKFFKYHKVERLDEEFAKKTDEDYIKLAARVKRMRDPKEMFNLVRRLPWKFSYNHDDLTLTSLATKHILVGYSFIKSIAVAVLLSVIYFLYTIFFFKIQFLKQLSVWFVIGMMYFWLMSGFNFFLKRYQFGKFTSQIQRFWKRTNTYFWLIEGFLLLLFFYYYLNSSQEPLYMYDYSSLNQEYLVSLHSIALNIILISLVIYFMYFTMLRLNSNSWTQISLYLLVISIFVFFSFFIETYQFYYVISVFNERLWVFNEEENLWLVDIDNPILRTKHQYLLVCLIAKYWHFLFIFLSWVFFLMKSFEKKKVTYVLFGANLQNMIILYALNFACYLQWFKWVYRRFFDLPYTWFFINIDSKFIYRLFSEVELLIFNLHNLNTSFSAIQLVVYKSMYMWNVDFLSIWKFI